MSQNLWLVQSLQNFSMEFQNSETCCKTQILCRIRIWPQKWQKNLPNCRNSAPRGENRNFFSERNKTHVLYIIRTASTWGIRICIVRQSSISFWPLTVKNSGHSWPLKVVSLNFIKSHTIYTSLEPSQREDSKSV